MQWTWTLECDLQLFILVPIFVLLYNRTSKVFAKLTAICLIVIGTLVNFFITKNDKLTAGIFSMDNKYLYAHFMSKPHTKIHVFALGLLVAMIFEEICDYQH
jgi:peptidoglycan/LPS O-acetylase OafA/YrhL